MSTNASQKALDRTGNGYAGFDARLVEHLHSIAARQQGQKSRIGGLGSLSDLSESEAAGPSEG